MSGVRGDTIRVVICDDHAVFRRGLVLVLEDEPDIEVVAEAADGESAVEVAVALQPDVVLLDVRMPGTTGIEAARQIRQRGPGVKLLMLTVSDEEEDLFEAIKAGASGYLLKAVSIEEVAASVRSVAAGQSLIPPSMAARLLSEFSNLAERAEAQREGTGPSPALRLTERERQVLRELARGLTNRDIGVELGISENTAKNHVRNILEKLNLHTRTEAAPLRRARGVDRGRTRLTIDDGSFLGQHARRSRGRRDGRVRDWVGAPLSNPLTGQFDAVLEVSGSTVNRLLASMHQNDRLNPKTPTLPHVVQGRIDAGTMHGAMHAQVSVPRIKLIGGSTDRFHLELSIRARYVPDSGSDPLPEFIHGTVGADYLVEKVDPTCRGWRHIADDYLWVRVVEESVTFRGSAVDDLTVGGLGVITGEDDATINARVTALIATLLKTQFEATPHKVSRAFRPGSLRSLDGGSDGTAVAIPLSLDGSAPLGSISGVNQVFLAGRDFAVAVNRDVILAGIQDALDQFRAGFYLQPRFQYTLTVAWVDVVDIDITWGVRLTAGTAEWLGPQPFAGGGGVVRVNVTGEAKTNDSQYNWSFNVTQYVVVDFDAASESFTAALSGDAAVDLVYNGPYASEAKAAAGPQVTNAIRNQIRSLSGVVGGGAGLGGSRAKLEAQLQTLDDHASTWFDGAEFNADGVVVRGGIGLASRRKPKVAFTKTGERDGYSALNSWMPGGRVDRFRWSWSWADGTTPGGSGGGDDRFVLRRPPGGWGRFGPILSIADPLPGLDGQGSVCLVVEGVQVDAGTGRFVDVTTVATCYRYGFIDTAVITAGPRLFLRDRSFVGAEGEELTHPTEDALVEVVPGGSSTDVANLLVLRVGDEWDPELADSLHEGIRACTRNDAGLQVLVLLPDDLVERAGRTALTTVLDDVRDLEAPVVVNEDVDGAWSKALNLSAGAPAWVLVTPSGGVAWAHHGSIQSDSLAEALDGHLFPSGAPGFGRLDPPIGIDVTIPPWSLHPGDQGSCPPPPVGRLDVRSVITFTQPNSDSSRRAVQWVGRDLASDGSDVYTAVVVDAPFADESDVRAAGLGPSSVVIADGDGVVARRFGIRRWPTTLVLDGEGAVVSVLAGADEEHRLPTPQRVRSAQA